MSLFPRFYLHSLDDSFMTLFKLQVLTEQGHFTIKSDQFQVRPLETDFRLYH